MDAVTCAPADGASVAGARTDGRPRVSAAAAAALVALVVGPVAVLLR